MEENKMLEKDFKQIVENIKNEVYKTQTLMTLVIGIAGIINVFLVSLIFR